jgi:hypothetical protein
MARLMRLPKHEEKTMYDRDALAIAAHAKASAEGLMDVIEFTLCTIQQPLQQVLRQRRDIAERGAESPYLFSSKRAGWVWAQDNKGYLWRVMLDILKREDSADRKADLIQHFMQVPGLGMVKAAFVVQMIGGGTACLDTHNLNALGMTQAQVKIGPKLKAETARRKVLDYVKLCDETGGAAHWWNRWCDYVAGRRGSPLKTGDEVSAYHFHTVCMS